MVVGGASGATSAGWIAVRGAPEGSVVLAVGDDDLRPALRHAVAEAVRTARPLHLVHVVPVPLAEGAALAVHDDHRRHGQRLMDRAAAGAADLLDRAGATDPPTGELLVGGSVVDGLVARARGAHLLVVQHSRARSGRPAWLVQSRTLSVAGRCAAPVLCVPAAPPDADPAARAASPSATYRGVTVAVQRPEGAGGLLTLALRVAASRSAALRVLHAWWLGDGHDALVLTDPEAMRTGQRARAGLEATLARLDLRGVPVRVEVVHRQPAEAVVEAGSSSDLVIVGRRDRRLPIGGHLGQVARAAVDHAVCPVLVSPERAPRHRA